MTEWAQDLKQYGEFPTDEILGHLVSLRKLDDQVQDTLFTGAAADARLTDARVLMHIRFLETQLDTWRRDSEGVQCQRKLLSTLEAAKRFFDTLLSFPASDYHLISFSEWMRLPSAMMTVAKLCIPSDAHATVGWDVKAAQNLVRLEICLEALCYRFKNQTTYDKVTQPHYDFWWAMELVTDMTRVWYLRKINPEPPTESSTQPTPSSSSIAGHIRRNPATLPTPSQGVFSDLPHVDYSSLDANFSAAEGGTYDPLSLMKIADFDMEQFFDVGIWDDTAYYGMGFGGGGTPF
ncbi:hypothetical protein N0V86_001445 [Didymella sp. IMI 355093]|nr:hypothetical protein N0V86_001445 [Didymella sp. IMI 355093]